MIRNMDIIGEAFNCHAKSTEMIMKPKKMKGMPVLYTFKADVVSLREDVFSPASEKGWIRLVLICPATKSVMDIMVMKTMKTKTKSIMIEPFLDARGIV